MKPDKFIRWEGDNQYEVESFCGRSIEEDTCPDILLIPCGFKMELKKCDLGHYVTKDTEGYLNVITNADSFQRTNN